LENFFHLPHTSAPQDFPSALAVRIQDVSADATLRF
jgi:hypothetical protein